MADAADDASSSGSSTTPPWRAQGSGPPPEVVGSAATASSSGNSGSDESVPEWKKKFKAMKERDQPKKASPANAPPKDDEEEKDVPEWMKKFKTMKEKNPGLDESASDLSVKSEHQGPTSKPPKQMPSSLDDANIPEWKRKLKEFQAKHQDHPVEPTKPKEKKEEIPEWKKKFNKMMHVDEGAAATTTQQPPRQPDARATAKPVSPEDSANIPEWKKKQQEMEKRKSLTEASASQMAEIAKAAEASSPDIAETEERQVEPQMIDQTTTTVDESHPSDDIPPEDIYGSLDAQPDDIYGALAANGVQITEEEAIEEEEVIESGGVQPSVTSDEIIEEEIIYEEYDEEIIEVIEEDEDDTTRGTAPSASPQGFTSSALASDVPRPIPQAPQSDGNQFQPSTTNSSFEAYQPRSQSLQSSLIQPAPRPPPGAPPIRHFPQSPDPPEKDHSRRRRHEEASLASDRKAGQPGIKERKGLDPDVVGASVVASITDEEAVFLNEIWENEINKDSSIISDEEAQLLDEAWQNELRREAEKQGIVTLQQPLLSTDGDREVKIEEEEEEGVPVFEDEYITRDEYQRKWWESPIVMFCACLVFCLLLGVAILLLLWLFVDSITLWEGDSDGKPDPTPPFVGDQPTTPMDPYLPGQCQSPGQLQPNVLTQCECDGQISSIRPDVRAKYEALRDTFISRIYPSWTLPIESCDPANQALFWLSTTIAADETDLLQRYGLAYLYYQTDGAQWRSRENWMTNQDVCLWYGIACSNELVSIVGLENNGLAGGPIPWEISLLSAIQNINFDGNDITGTIPGELFLLPILRQMSLSSNQLRGSIPRNIGNARNLETLRLDNNLLEGPISPELGRATSLQDLDLSYNQFSNTIPTDMYRLTELRSLNLENNVRLIGRLPTEFGRFTDLEFFSISNTTIRARIPREYEALTKLTDLRMANTLVGGNIPEEIGVLSDLFNTDLSDSRFRQTIPTILGNFRDMTVLLLNNNGLTGEIPSELGLLTKLTTLLLDGNALEGTLPTEVGDLSMLQTLTLEMNPRLTGRIPSEVCDLRSLMLDSFTIDCPTRELAPICPIPSCCTRCIRITDSGSF